jgi:hypothetical protein
MQFFNVLEKKCCRYRAAAATIFSKTYRCRDDFFQNLPQPRRDSGDGSGSAAMNISVSWIYNSTNQDMILIVYYQWCWQKLGQWLYILVKMKN